MQRTFAMIKPDSVQRGLIGEIIRRFEAKGLRVDALKLVKVTERMAEELYREHEGKAFYESLMTYITSGPVVAMILSGPEAIAAVRRLNGATNPLEATPGTIRGDFGLTVDRNIVHATDSPEKAEREWSIFFSDDEIVQYRRAVDEWIDPS